MRGVSFADAQGAADLLGDDDAAEVIHATNNARCFHISFSFTDVAGTNGPLV